MQDRIAGRCGFNVMQGAAAGADELPDLHPFGIGNVAVRIDLAERPFGFPNMDERLELPVLAVVAVFMAAFTLGDAALRRFGDEKMIADGQENPIAPVDALLQDLDQLEEAILILVGAHDPLGLMPRKSAGDEIANDLLAVARHSALSPNAKFSSSDQNARKD